MASTVEACEYEAISDPVELGIVLRELWRTVALIREFGDLASESVNVPAERVVGFRAAGSLVAGVLLRSAENQMFKLIVQEDRSGNGVAPTTQKRASGV